MQRIPFKFNKLHYGCFIAGLALSLNAMSEEVEFDERFLGTVAGQPTADVNKYRSGNPIPSGEYLAEVYVNGVRQGNALLKVVENSETPLAGLCLTPQLAAVMSLQESAFHLSPSDTACINTLAAIPEAKIQFDVGSLALNLELPQALVVKRPRGYVDPSQWDAGSPVLFVRYDANQYISDTAGNRSQRRYVGLKGGLNVAGWSVRHQGSQTWNNQQKQPYQYQYTYAQRDIDAIKGQITLGDFYTSGDFFENLAIRGLKIESDDRMLPYSQRGYAPRIEGIAHSNNAQVIVRQDGYIIYETTVPAGAFAIDDLYPTGYSGKLDVEIIEADGQRRTFSVPFSNAVRLVRAGQLRYKASAGRYREGSKLFPESLFQGEINYGLFNGLTLNLGTTAARDYLAGLAGVAFDTPIGAFSSDFIYSRAKFPHLNQQLKQRAVNFGYNAQLNRYGSYFSASAYRSFSPNSYALSQLFEINRNRKLLDKTDRLRQRLSFSFSQTLGKHFGSIAISGIRNQYWNKPQAVNEYQFSYGNSYKQLQYQIGYAQSHDPNEQKEDKQIYLNASLQFGAGQNSPTLYTNYQKNNDSYFAQTALAGTFGEDSQFNYNLAANRQTADNSYSLNLGYKASIATLNVGAAKSRTTKQTNVNVSGAIVAHPKGITLSNDLGDTFAIIHAKGASGAKINNGNAAHLDWFGNGIVPYVSPYQVNYVGIDPNNVPNDVEIEATGQEIIPRANSAVLVKFATKSGQSVLFDVSLADGSAPPLAAEVFDEQQQQIGYVVQGGRVFVRGIAESGKLHIVWGAGEQERCQFSYRLKDNHQDAYAVQCMK